MAKIKISSSEDFESIRSHWLVMVEALADEAAPSQRDIYPIKYAEACAGSGPHIEAEAEAQGVTVGQMCERVMQARQASDALSAKVEAARVKAKIACQQADDAHACFAAYLDLKADLDCLR